MQTSLQALRLAQGAPLAPPGWRPSRSAKEHAPRSNTSTSSSSNSTAEIVTLNPASIQPVHCLKEWSPICAALGTGQQTILVRKGGIREPCFTPKAMSFLLFPTAFHTDAQLLKPGAAEQFQQEVDMQPREMDQLPLQYFAQVTGTYITQDPQVLRVLDSLHVYSDGFLDTRLKWRAQEPLTLLELRCYRLQQPLQISVAEREAYFGCFSWVELEQADVQQGSSWQLQPALDHGTFAERQQVLRAGLELLDATALQL